MALRPRYLQSLLTCLSIVFLSVSAHAQSVLYSAVVSSSVTRIANTTTYTALTGWCTLASSCVTYFTWTGVCAANGGRILIPQIDIWSSANPTTKLTGNVWILNAAPGTIIQDDVTFTLAAADYANLVIAGGVAFALTNPGAAASANSGTSLVGQTYMVQCAPGSSNLYGMAEVANAYVSAPSCEKTDD